MPTWGDILLELQTTVRQNGAPDFDRVRRKYLGLLAAHTGRPAILYASAYLDKPGSPNTDVNLGDVQGFMEAVRGLQGESLDLILHSPGGSAEAAESIVQYLRTKFSDIRVFVPLAAKSAATMLAMGADEIVLGAHSELGPIDPQMVLPTQAGMKMVPADAILQEFKRAQRECRDSSKMAAWVPILHGFHPGLMAACISTQRLARDMVAQWLESYMFRNQPDKHAKARQIASWLANHRHFRSHSRQISRDMARAKGLTIIDLEADNTLQDLVLSVYHATTHTFKGTQAVKIIENSNGKCLATMAAGLAVGFMGPSSAMPFLLPAIRPEPVAIPTTD